MTSVELADLDRPIIRRLSESGRISSALGEEKTDVDSAAFTLYNEEAERTRFVDLEQEKSEALATGPRDPNSRLKLTVWMTVNTLATIGIVSEHPEKRTPDLAQRELTMVSRSSPTKPSSPILPSDPVRFPSHRSTSSSPRPRFTSFRGRSSPCSLRSMSRCSLCYHWLLPCASMSSS